MDRSPSEGRLVVIDRGRERFVRLQRAARLEDFAGQQPVDGREGPSAFVVRRDDEVDVPRLVVRVAERDDGDADVQRLPNACWSAAGSVTRITSGSMKSGRFGLVRV